ncbi:MAG: hypothetical protein ACYS6I_02640 [Planctomycetota bacterium]
MNYCFVGLRETSGPDINKGMCTVYIEGQHIFSGFWYLKNAPRQSDRIQEPLEVS